MFMTFNVKKARFREQEIEPKFACSSFNLSHTAGKLRLIAN